MHSKRHLLKNDEILNNKIEEKKSDQYCFENQNYHLFLNNIILHMNHSLQMTIIGV